MKEKLKKFMTPFQWAEVLAIIAFTVYFAVTNTTNTWWYILIDSLAAVCGVFCVVLCAGGKKSQYYWGFVNIVAYIVIAMINKYYGEVMLNGLYYLPTQFIGLWVWGKHYKKQEDQVEGLRMDAKHIAVWSVCSVAGIFVYKLILDALQIGQMVMDKKAEESIRDSILRFVKNYGLLGIISALPASADFYQNDRVYILKNRGENRECLSAGYITV